MILTVDVPRMTSRDCDEMAIPSYLHKNPLIRWLMWRRYEVIAGMAGFRKDMAVLEFGCGLGLFLAELSDSCGTVHAIDRFPEYAKELCRQMGLKVHFLDEVSQLPDDSLDVIVAADVLEHIEHTQLQDLMTVFSRKLKSTGRLLVCGPTENLVYKIGRAVAGFRGKGDYHVTNVDSLVTTLSNTFLLSRVRQLPFPWPPVLFKVAEFRPRS